MFKFILYRDTFLAPIVVGFMAQCIKMMIYSLLLRRFLPGRLLQFDGMPNLHGAVFGSLTTVICVTYGIGSLLFSVVATYSAIVIHDTMRLKRAKEKQVDMLNRLISNIDEFGGLGTARITRVLQYRPLDVLAGVLLGVLTTYAIMT